MLQILPDAPRTRAGVVLPIEGNRWVVLLQGLHGDAPPADRQGVVDFTESLPSAEIGNLLCSQRWVSDGIQQYPYPASRRNRYEELDNFPDGLVVTGDAMVSFNPIYGQGMSLAALESVVLHHALRDGGLDDIGSRFFERTATLVDTVWRMVVGGDFAFSETTGPKPPGTDIPNWYMKRLIQTAQTDSVVSSAFSRVVHPLQSTNAAIWT